MENCCAVAKPENKRVWSQDKSEFANSPLFSIRKYPESTHYASPQYFSFLKSTEVMHRPRSDFPLHLILGTCSKIRTEKQNASARRLLSAAMPEC